MDLGILNRVDSLSGMIIVFWGEVTLIVLAGYWRSADPFPKFITVFSNPRLRGI
jgi:hypothetical protein